MYYCVLMRVCCWVTYSHESCCCRQQNKANRCGFKEIFEERAKEIYFYRRYATDSIHMGK